MHRIGLPPLPIDRSKDQRLAQSERDNNILFLKKKQDKNIMMITKFVKNIRESKNQT